MGADLLSARALVECSLKVPWVCREGVLPSEMDELVPFLVLPQHASAVSSALKRNKQPKTGRADGDEDEAWEGFRCNVVGK